MLSFKEYLLESDTETNPVHVDTYHGSGKLFKKFEQRHARIEHDHMGGGVGYFTDDKDVGKSYANHMAKYHKTNTPYLYHTGLKMNNVFDVDHKFSGEKLKKLLPHPSKHEDFARGAGLLKLGADKYDILAKLKTGSANLKGHEVFNGLSRALGGTSRARDHLIKNGYDGLRYNGGDNMDAKRHNVYIPYNADSIKINKITTWKK